jgi:Ni,Fe-hydrogenase III small subunit
MAWRQVMGHLRHGPATEPAPPLDTAMVAALAERLEASSRRRLGRGLRVRHLDAGSCNGCELELRMLDSVVYDLSRFGIAFVASPRHADVLLVTGPMARNMAEAAARTFAAMAEPKWVVALGDCAADGGIFRGGRAVLDGAAGVLPVDLVVRGCPPTPAQVLDALRALVEANAG